MGMHEALQVAKRLAKDKTDIPQLYYVPTQFAEVKTDSESLQGWYILGVIQTGISEAP